MDSKTTTDFVARALAGDGLCLRTGDLVYRVKSPFRLVAEGIAALYSRLDIIEAEFADFHLSVDPMFEWTQPFTPHAVVHIADGFCSPAFPATHAVAYLEWCFNRCVFTRWFHRLILHAGVLERDGRAVVLVGESGAGKSTLSAALAVSGWHLLSDELTVVSTVDGTLSGLARPVALKNESIDIIRALAPEARFGPIAHGTPKGTIAHMAPPGETHPRATESLRPSSFVFVRHKCEGTLEIEPVSKGQAFVRVAQNAAINYSSLGVTGFNTLVDAVERADCYDLRYSKLDEALEFFGSSRWTSCQ